MEAAGRAVRYLWCEALDNDTEKGKQICRFRFTEWLRRDKTQQEAQKSPPRWM